MYCNENLDVHHIIPQKLEKIDAYWNLLLLHQSCHKILHSNKDIEKAISNLFLPDPKRMIKKNTKTSWKKVILSYVDNIGEGS